MKKNIVIIAVLGLAVVFVMNVKNRKQSGGCPLGGCPNGVCTLPIPAGRPLGEDPRVKVCPVKKALPRLLDLGADKCVPCKKMAPILDEMKETFKEQLVVDFVDVWKNKAEAEKYGIKSIPTQIFFDAEGKELFRHMGFFPRADMLAKWKELGYDFK